MLQIPDVREAPATFWSALPSWAQTGISVAAVIVGATIVTWVVRRSITRTVSHLTRDAAATREETRQRRETVGGVLRTAATGLIWTISLLLALGYAGVNLAPFIAAAGIGGVALGFGAQNLIRDFLAGFFILLEDQFHVGDIVTLVGVTGVVETIKLRNTVLRDLDGRVHTVPNGEITVSSNFTKGFSRYLLDLPVPYDEDIDRTVDVVREAFEQMRSEPSFTGTILGPLEVLGVNEYGDSEILVRMYLETLPGRQWDVGREFRRRIKLAYDAAGISIPFPHRQLIIKAESSEGEQR